ncbi:floral homeotic protein AGAMOUS [Cajanus cajan]|uniref:MADS-box transcription factor PHERES 2 n=1 Tax=Cajanus cajan TaxID=3821 RepID=A0A151TIU9_CAJCA|nr:floral homeotic protein AGAMOUS [Cajanus cajan]XP_020222130.1 floral homeotic protein AGAMOUS [Cajanus cajan]KYP61222.1 MADS-box transcription factor PHERES 2 [Cajanus cajan]KYP66949.1 MADS-box transcription factor PHERES 2 [Cajanus cajan]
MVRGRIAMKLIEKEKSRKTTFHKRKNGLMKKAYEFATLCGVDVGVIIYAPDFLKELETWPQDSEEIKRVIQKLQNTTRDRCPKVYDVEEYFSERMKKIEGEISKVHKAKIKVMYPTWDDSYNTLGEEQLRRFVGILDAKLDACNRRMNMLKRDSKGKAKAESDTAEILTPYMASNLGSHMNFMQNMSQAQIFYPMKSTSDNNQVALYPFQLGQSSKSSMFHFGPNCTQLMGKNGMVDWANQVGVVACDPKKGILEEDVSQKSHNSSPCYSNGNIQTMQPYNVSLQTLPSQLQYNATFQTLPRQPGPPPGSQLNDSYDSNMLQRQYFYYMHGGPST